MSHRARSVVLVLAGLSLAACGSVNPGDAAVVDGRSITMDAVDDVASAYCELALASSAAQGQGAVIDNSLVRRETLELLVTLDVARDLADQEGVTPSAAEIELTDQDEAFLASVEGDSADVRRVLERITEISTIVTALGAEATGQQPTADNAEELQAAGGEQLTAALDASDIDVAPRFGLDGRLQPAGTTGSLSVTAAAPEDQDPAALPATQRCA